MFNKPLLTVDSKTLEIRRVSAPLEQSLKEFNQNEIGDKNNKHRHVEMFVKEGFRGPRKKEGEPFVCLSILSDSDWVFTTSKLCTIREDIHRFLLSCNPQYESPRFEVPYDYFSKGMSEKHKVASWSRMDNVLSERFFAVIWPTKDKEEPVGTNKFLMELEQRKTCFESWAKQNV